MTKKSQNNQHSATIDDVLKVVKTLATKDEFKEVSQAVNVLTAKNQSQIDNVLKVVKTLATKDELNQAVSGLATKDELNQAVSGLATKDELNQAVSGLATKDELNQAVNTLAVKTQGQIDEVLEAINIFADETHQEFSNIKTEISGMKGEFGEIKERLTSVEMRGVTKEYLDDKLSDLRGDLVVMTRKEDIKLKTLVTVLKKKEVIDSNDAEKVYSLEPFAE